MVVRIAPRVRDVWNDPREHCRRLRRKPQPNKLGEVMQVPIQAESDKLDGVPRGSGLKIQKSHSVLSAVRRRGRSLARYSDISVGHHPSGGESGRYLQALHGVLEEHD